VEAMHLEELYNEFKHKGLQVITVLVGNPSEWAKQYNLTFPVLDDSRDSIWEIYGENYVPLNIIVDRACVIRYKQAGFDEDELKRIIRKYL